MSAIRGSISRSWLTNRELDCCHDNEDDIEPPAEVRNPYGADLDCYGQNSVICSSIQLTCHKYKGPVTECLLRVSKGLGALEGNLTVHGSANVAIPYWQQLRPIDPCPGQPLACFLCREWNSNPGNQLQPNARRITQVAAKATHR